MNKEPLLKGGWHVTWRNLGRGATHILGLQQLLAALVAIGMRYHFGVHASVVTTREDSHGHAGVHCSLKLPRNLCDLLMSACAEEDLWNRFPSASLFVFFVVLGLFNRFLSCFEVATRTERTRHGRLLDTKREKQVNRKRYKEKQPTLSIATALVCQAREWAFV